MKGFGQYRSKSKIPAAVIFLISLSALAYAAGFSYSGSDRAQGDYEGILQEQIKSTHEILNAKEEEYQEGKDDNLRTGLMEKAIRKKADSLFQGGYGYYKARQYEPAIAAFKEALAIYPEHKRSKEYLAKSTSAYKKAQEEALLAQQRSRAKEEKIRQRMLEESKRKRLTYHYLKGKKLLADKQYKEAIDEFSEVLLIDPSHQYARRLLAEAEDKASGREGSEAEIRDNFALAIGYIEDDEYTKAKNELENILAKIERLEKDYRQRAISQSLRIETEKKSGKVITHMGEQEYEQAREEINGLLEKVSKLSAEKQAQDEKNIIAQKVNWYFNAALELIDKGDYRKAKSELEKVLEVDPGNKEAAFLLERVKEIIMISGSN